MSDARQRLAPHPHPVKIECADGATIEVVRDAAAVFIRLNHGPITAGAHMDHAAVARVADALRPTPTLAQTLNVLKILRSLDHCEVEFLQWNSWERFRDDPYRFLMRADDDTQAAIWAAVEKQAHWQLLPAPPATGEG